VYYPHVDLLPVSCAVDVPDGPRLGRLEEEEVELPTGVEFPAGCAEEPRLGELPLPPDGNDPVASAEAGGDAGAAGASGFSFCRRSSAITLSRECPAMNRTAQ
jgi:hypothetical protein